MSTSVGKYRVTRRERLYADPGVTIQTVAYGELGRQDMHCHDATGITLFLGGGVEETGPFGTRVGGACDVVVKPPDTPHANDYGANGLRTVQIVLTRAFTGEWNHGPAYRWHAGGPAAKSMLSLMDIARDGDAGDVHGGVIDLLAALSDDERVACSHRALDDLADRLRADCTEPVSVRTLAEEAGMHPVSLARAFRQRFGCSITEYVRRHRVIQACRRIEGNGEALSAVAAETGFADQPHLTRAFRKELGLPPGKFRTLVRA